KSTSGGSSDTDVNEFTVTPTCAPSAMRVVTIVTPVPNCPSAARSARGSKAPSAIRSADLLRFGRPRRRVGRHQPVDQADGTIPVIGPERMTACHHVGACIEHFVLLVA